MKTKDIVTLLVIIAFTVGTIGIAFADAENVKGAVTKIEDNKITVKDAVGKETTVEVKSTANIKVGDRVIIKNKEVTKERPRRVIEGC